MNNLLITGGAGFIGSNFTLYMAREYKNMKIINLDSLTYAGNLANLKSLEGYPNYIFIQADVCDAAKVSDIIKTYDIDTVVHFAAESHVDRSIHDPNVFAQTNILGTLNLLNAVKVYWMKGQTGYRSDVRYVQISTDEVYGSLGDTGYFTEMTPLDPHSPYSASKASADMFVKAYADTFGIPVNITRCSNNYGPYQFPEKLIPLIINNALNHKSLPIYGDGKNIRDWLYVEDHCKAINAVLHKGRQGEIYNIGGHNECTNIEIVRLIINYLHEKVDNTIGEDLITYVEDRKGHDRRYAINADKAQKELEWQPDMPFKKGIIKTIEWYLQNKEWLKTVTNGSYKEYYKKMYKGGAL